jgi:hypothetical protein
VGQPSVLLTKKQLADHATARGIPVSNWQVDEWIQDGMLPPAEPTPPGEKPRGRPHKRYGEQAFEAVCWLGEHRSQIDGAEVARFWMWLWGFDHMQVDLSAVVLASIERQWARMREDIPSLPPIDQIDRLSDRQMDQLYDSDQGSVLNEYDAFARSQETGPLGEQGPSLAYLAGMVGGAIPPDGLDSYRDQDEVDGADITRSLVDLFVEGGDAGERFADALRGSRMIDVYQAVKRDAFDLALVRTVWHVVTPQFLAALMGIPFTPLARKLFGPICDRASLMRALRYDPVAIVGMAILFEAKLPGGLAHFAEALTTTEKEASRDDQ